MRSAIGFSGVSGQPLGPSPEERANMVENRDETLRHRTRATHVFMWGLQVLRSVQPLVTGVIDGQAA